MPGAGEATHPFGRYKNVFLTDAEYDELYEELPTVLGPLVDRLSEYMASSGKHYENHAATIRKWAREDEEKRRQQRVQPARKGGNVFLEIMEEGAAL